MKVRDIEERADIEAVVASFYELVRRDDLLGELFERQIGPHWGDHQARVCDFWETVQLGGTQFKSRALLRHLDVDDLCPLCPFHFNRWCTLFERSVEHQFCGKTADRAITRARAMSHSLQLQLSRQRGSCPLAGLLQ
jgi:hemoglobin